MKKISKELKFIRGFSSTSVNNICKELNIDRSNLINNKLKEETVQIVYDKLVLELTDLISKCIKEK